MQVRNFKSNSEPTNLGYQNNFWTQNAIFGENRKFRFFPKRGYFPLLWLQENRENHPIFSQFSVSMTSFRVHCKPMMYLQHVQNTSRRFRKNKNFDVGMRTSGTSDHSYFHEIFKFLAREHYMRTSGIFVPVVRNHHNFVRFGFFVKKCISE